MDRTFSVDDVSETFWPSSAPPPPPSSASSATGGAAAAAAAAMNRSPSEWLFQKFLEETAMLSPKAVSNPTGTMSTKPNPKPNPSTSSSANGGVGKSLIGSGVDDVVEIKPPAFDPQPGQVDPEKYAEHLKQQLEIYCKAVAMSRVGISFFPVEFEFQFQLNFSGKDDHYYCA